jgi:hypothetical protein
MLSTSARSLQMAWEVVRKSVPRECLEAHEITWTILLVFASVWLHIIVYPITFCLELCWCKLLFPQHVFHFHFIFPIRVALTAHPSQWQASLLTQARFMSSSCTGVFTAEVCACLIQKVVNSSACGLYVSLRSERCHESLQSLFMACYIYYVLRKYWLYKWLVR